MRRVGAVGRGGRAGRARPAWPGAGRFTAEAIDKGRQQYNRICVQCHGRNLVNAGTTVYDLRKFPLDQPERFRQSVLQGKGAMPSWKERR